MCEGREILVVEDDPGDLELARRLLETAGYRGALLAAETGDEAIRQLRLRIAGRRCLPSFVLLDLNLPGRNGFRVLESLRSDPALEGIPAVILSTSDAERDRSLARRLGARAYLRKPTTPEEVRAAAQRLAELSQLLTGRPLADPSEEPGDAADSRIGSLGDDAVLDPAPSGPAPLSLLVIDDDPGDVDILRNLLADEPLALTHAATAREALDWLEERHADVILLDYRLDCGTGLELLRELRSGSGSGSVRRAPPVIFMSGYGSEELATRAIHEGARSYLPKQTLSRDSLRRALWASVARGGQDRADAALVPDREERDRVVAACQGLSGDFALLKDCLERLSEEGGDGNERAELLRECRAVAQRASGALDTLRRMHARAPISSLADTTMVDIHPLPGLDAEEAW